MKLIDKFIPSYCYKDIYEVDYNKLYSDGVKIIFFDLDNTIQRNIDKAPSEIAINKIKEIKELGFKVYLLSNNSYERIEETLNILNIEGFGRTKKPLKKNINKVINMLVQKKYINSSKEICLIGDQVLTDVWGANNTGMKSILVKPIDLTTEKWYTSLNRNTERRIIKKIKKRNPAKYDEIMKAIGD